jgi:hypothetical protein
MTSCYPGNVIRWKQEELQLAFIASASCFENAGLPDPRQKK